MTLLHIAPILITTVSSNKARNHTEQMEYRKKHLKPKKALAQDMSNILMNEIHMDQIDFF